MDARTVWTVEFFVDSRGVSPFKQFLERLSDAKFSAVEVAVQHILKQSGISLASTPWLKALGDGVFEFRIRNNAYQIVPEHIARNANAPAKILLRVFVHFYGDRKILVLHGYDKAANDSLRFQSQQIQLAKDRLRSWKLQ